MRGGNKDKPKEAVAAALSLHKGKPHSKFPSQFSNPRAPPSALTRDNLRHKSAALKFATNPGGPVAGALSGRQIKKLRHILSIPTPSWEFWFWTNSKRSAQLGTAREF